jgi:hypothetical protein
MYYYQSLTKKSMNKKIITTIVSVILGTSAYTSVALANDLGLGVSVGSNVKVSNSNSDDDNYKFENKINSEVKGNILGKLEKFWSENNKNKGGENKENKKEHKDSSLSSKTEAERMAALKLKASTEIDSQITALNNLNARVQASTNITAANKATVAAAVGKQINALVALKAKINADTEMSTLKRDIASIKKLGWSFGFLNFRHNLLTEVDTHFAKINALASTTASLTIDVNSAQTAGKDVTTLRAKLAEMNTKIADANVQSNAALALIAPILPDMGSSTIKTANKAVIADAYAKYKLALKDIKEIRASAKSIINQLKEWGVTVTANLSVK